MAISKKSLSDFEKARLEEVLAEVRDDVEKIPVAVKNAMHGVSDQGARYRLRLALTEVTTRIVTNRANKATSTIVTKAMSIGCAKKAWHDDHAGYNK